jgi:hypothetical protein
MGGKLDIMKRIYTLLAILNKGHETLFTAEAFRIRRERHINSIDQMCVLSQQLEKFSIYCFSYSYYSQFMPLKPIRHLRWGSQMYLWSHNTVVNLLSASLDETMNYDFAAAP